MIDKLPKMNRVEMVRSDISGQFFPSSECEIVVIKIVKHKDEKMTAYNPVAPRETEYREEVKPEEKKLPLVNLGTKEGNEIAQMAHSIIPKHMRDIFGSGPPLA